MANFEHEFTKQLDHIHHNIRKIEHKTIRNDKNINLTVNEIHLIDCIKLSTKGGEGPTISIIANALDITRPSATVAVNKLEAKKYVEKTGSLEDGRSVKVKLTAKGEKAYSFLKKHNELVASGIKKLFSDEELSALAAAFEKIDKYFDDKASKADEEF